MHNLTLWHIIFLILKGSALAIFELLIVSVLVLVLSVYEIPKLRVISSKNKNPILSDKLIQYAKQAMFYSGFLVAVFGLSIATLYMTGNVSKELNDRLSGVGTGVTMYAAGLAVVSLIGVKNKYIDSTFLDRNNARRHLVDYQITDVMFKIREIEKITIKLNLICIINLCVSTILAIIASLSTIYIIYSG